MRDKRLIRCISVLLCGVILLSICSCSQNKKATEAINIEPMEAETAYAYSFDFIGGTDVMPITGFYGPMASDTSINGVAIPDYVTDEIFSMIADCGINFLAHTYTDYSQAPQYVKKMMELGEKYGLGVVVKDAALSKDAELSLIDARVNEYRNYPAFCGIYVVDEPCIESYYYTEGRTISEYSNIINTLSEVGIWSYGNLFPIYDANKRETYDAYLEEWLTTCDVKMLMWDHYVHDKSGHTKADYFYNLSVCREKAEKYQLPFWTYVQAGSQWNDAGNKFDTDGYYPNEGQFMWNVNTCLAYGAKGIAYFPMIQPYYFAYAESQPYDFERNGLIGASGNKNRWWYYAKNANQQIAAIDEILMNSVNKGVIVTGARAKADNADASCIIEGNTWRELIGITGDTMVGCFNYQGKSAYYVVNYDMEYAQEITLEFYDNCNFTVTQKAETSKLQGEGITLTMAPGEGVLVVME